MSRWAASILPARGGPSSPQPEAPPTAEPPRAEPSRAPAGWPLGDASRSPAGATRGRRSVGDRDATAVPGLRTAREHGVGRPGARLRVPQRGVPGVRAARRRRRAATSRVTAPTAGAASHGCERRRAAARPRPLGASVRWGPRAAALARGGWLALGEGARRGLGMFGDWHDRDRSTRREHGVGGLQSVDVAGVLGHPA